MTLIMVAFVLPISAQDWGQDLTIKIWDNSTAPHSNDITEPMVNNRDFISRTSQTMLYIYKAQGENPTDKAILICPGGGYSTVCVATEGYTYAKWLQSQGITCAVLLYRLPNGHKEVPLEDTVEALRTLRKNAQELKIDPKKVGIMGFSAGGHLAAYTSTLAPEGEKPAFSVLFYPVITGEQGLTHEGTFNELLGRDASAIERASYSLENRVTRETPPALLLLSDHDTVVPTISSVRYYSALKKHGINASMHIYPNGWHGWQIGHFEYEKQWQASLLDWLKQF